MNDADRKAIAGELLAALRESGCTIHGTCQTFDAETIASIKAAAAGYSKLMTAGRWAGLAFATVVITTLAAGFCAALWAGFCSMVKP
jgi:hypothetical protein